MKAQDKILVRAWWKKNTEVICTIIRVHDQRDGTRGFSVRPEHHHHQRYVDAGNVIRVIDIAPGRAYVPVTLVGAGVSQGGTNAVLSKP